MLTGDPEAAVESLRKGLPVAPGMFVALEQQGRRHEAMLACFSAIDVAQAQERQLDDATFEHEARNHSERTCVVPIMGSWNSDASEVEQTAMTNLVAALGGLNRSSETAAPRGPGDA